MAFAILVILILLWLAGYIQIPGLVIPNFSLFIINGHQITLWDILIFLVLAGLLGVLPSPVREIAGVLFLLWILSVLGIFSIFAFTSLPAVIVGLVILGLVAYIFAYPRV